MDDVVLVSVLAVCGFGWASAILMGGLIHLGINKKTPTPKTRRWGAVFGAANVLHGLAFATFLVLFATTEMPHPPAFDVYVLIGMACGASLFVGAGDLFFAARRSAAQERA
jgi:hypothetical protein